MGKAGRKKKRDADVLRAEDIVPPYGKKAGQKASSRKTKAGRKKTPVSQKKRKGSSKDVKSPVSGKKPAKRKAAKSPKAEQRAGEIPKFDLGEQILAEQRKITAVKRKGPGKKGKEPVKEPEVEPIGPAARSAPELSEHEQVIAEIVARDIERLCEGDASKI
ncbi:MAG: hypothetical protein KAY65_13860 [Planctomycetes bacterium]|nr:hypothetical protein [Planctomycetota bacterium]